MSDINKDHRYTRHFCPAKSVRLVVIKMNHRCKLVRAGAIVINMGSFNTNVDMILLFFNLKHFCPAKSVRLVIIKTNHRYKLVRAINSIFEKGALSTKSEKKNSKLCQKKRFDKYEGFIILSA